MHAVVPMASEQRTRAEQKAQPRSLYDSLEQEMAQRAARELSGVAGSEVTPRLLARMAELSGGKTLDLNVELVVNNARVAAQVAAASARSQS